MTGKIVWDPKNIEVRIEMKAHGRIEAQRLAILELLIARDLASISVATMRPTRESLWYANEGQLAWPLSLIIRPKPGVPKDLLRQISQGASLTLELPAQLALPEATTRRSEE